MKLLWFEGFKTFKSQTASTFISSSVLKMLSEPNAREVVFTLLSYTLWVSKSQIQKKLTLIEERGGDTILSLMIFSMARWKTSSFQDRNVIQF